MPQFARGSHFRQMKEEHTDYASDAYDSDLEATDAEFNSVGCTGISVIGVIFVLLLILLL